MAKQKITDIQALTALKRIEGGERLTNVAKSIGMTGSGLRDRLRKMGYNVGGYCWTRLSPAIVADVLRRVRCGERVTDIARELQVGPMTLHKHIRKKWHPVGRVRRTSCVSMPKSPVVLAYIAGIFDGEGWISKRRTKDGGYWCIGICNTHREVLIFISDVTGAFVDNGRQRACPKNVNKLAKVSYSINIQSSLGVFRFLAALLPYLIIKKEKAVECLKELGTYISIEEYDCSIWDQFK